jgi:hypothetical protein
VTKVLSITSIDARSFNQDCWFVIPFATAAKKKRHQSEADKQGENDAESHRDIARRWYVGISEGPTEIGGNSLHGFNRIQFDHLHAGKSGSREREIGK